MARFSFIREDDTPTEDPKDTPEDTTQVTDSNDEPKDENVVNVLPDPSELNVSAVDLAQHELQAKIEEADKKNEELTLPEEDRQIALKDAQDESDNVTAAMEALAHTLQTSGAPDRWAMRYAVNTCHRLSQKYNISSYGVKMENFKSYTKRHDQRQTVMEGLGQILRDIWESILKLVRRAKEWLKDFFKKLFFSTKGDISKTEDKMKSIKSTREKMDKSHEPMNKENWIASPELHICLSIDNKVAPGHIKAFQTITELSLIEQRIKENVYVETADGMQEYLKEMDDANFTGDQDKCIINELSFFTVYDPDKLMDVTKADKDDVAAGEKAPPDFVWLKTDTLPGEFKLAFLVHKDIFNPSVYDNLGKEVFFQSYKNWKIKAINGEKTATSGWFPFYTTDELEEISTILHKASTNMLALEKSTKNIDDVFDKVIDISNAAIKKAKEIDLGQANTASQYKYVYSNEVIQSLKTITETVRATLSAVSIYIKRTHQAWNYFLDLVEKKEKDTLAKPST